MATKLLSSEEADELFDFILDHLRDRDLDSVADQIQEVANSRVLEELEPQKFSGVARNERSKLSTKSVRPRTSRERLEVAIELLDARLRAVPRVVEAAQDRLGSAETHIVLRPDDTAVEGTLSDSADERSEVVDLDDLRRPASIYTEISILWEALRPSENLDEMESERADT